MDKKNISLAQALQLKRELEDDIRTLINKFSEKTNLCPYAIEIRSTSFGEQGGEYMSVLTGLSLKIDL